MKSCCINGNPVHHWISPLVSKLKVEGTKRHQAELCLELSLYKIQIGVLPAVSKYSG